MVIIASSRAERACLATWGRVPESALITGTSA